MSTLSKRQEKNGECTKGHEKRPLPSYCREKAPKNWDAKTRQDILDSHAIIAKHWIKLNRSLENFTWAQNGGGAHTKKAATNVADKLREADAKGTKQDVVDALNNLGANMKQGIFW